MVRRTATKRVDRLQAPGYAETGRVFWESAKALSTVAEHGAPYGNAIGLLAIHAAISYTDALSIAFGAKKSVGEHTDCVEVLRDVLGEDLPPEVARRLDKILSMKNNVSYQGAFYSIEAGRKLLALADAYCTWARDLLQRRR